MEKWQAEFFNKTVSDIMTTTPKDGGSKHQDFRDTAHHAPVQGTHRTRDRQRESSLKGIVDHYACMV